MKTEFFLVDADYVKEKGEVLVRLFGLTGEGETVAALFPYEPYFYVLTPDVQKAQQEVKATVDKKKVRIKRVQKVKRSLKGEIQEFLKIFCHLPQDTQKIRDTIKHLEKKRGGSGSVIEEYEYTVNFYRRFLLDKGIAGGCWCQVEGEPLPSKLQVELTLRGESIDPTEKLTHPPLRCLSFDVETYEGKGERQIIMLSLWGERFKKVLTYQKGDFPTWVEVVDGEKELLKRFVEIVTEYNPDVLFSYNGDAFDFSVIRERARHHKVKLTLSRDGKGMKFARRARVSSARMKGRAHLDLYHFVNNILAPNLQTEVLTLDAVSSELLGDEKIEMDYQELLESWRKKKNLFELARYCLTQIRKFHDYPFPEVFSGRLRLCSTFIFLP